MSSSSLLRLMALFGSSLLISSANAATFTVTNRNDSGRGSLRQAIDQANATTDADTIVFASSTRGTITLTRGELTVKSDLTIKGSGASNLILSGGGTQRLLIISNGKVSMQDLTLSNGSAVGMAGTNGKGEAGGDALGGAIFNQGELTLSNVQFSNNAALGGNGGMGSKSRGWFEGDIRAINGGSGGAGRGGALFNAGSLTLLNTVFTGNQAVGGQGGAGGNFHSQNMFRFYVGNGGAGGSAYGGAIYNAGTITKGSLSSPSGSSFSSNHVVKGQGGAPGEYRDVKGVEGQGGQGFANNIRDLRPTASDVTIHAQQFRALSGQLIGTGDTLSYVITSGTLPEGVTLNGTTGLISGASSIVSNDIVVGYKTSDGYRQSEEAFIHFSIQPLNPKDLIVNTLSDVSNDQDSKNTLREAITFANSLTIPQTITFESGVSGTIVLTNGTLYISHDMTIAASPNQSIAVDGNKQYQVFYIQGGTTSLSNLTITRGGDAGILNEGTLHLTGCTLSNNVSKSNGGGVYNSPVASLTVNNCTFVGNKAVGNKGAGFEGFGGGIYSVGNLSVDSSTIVGNSCPINGGGIYNEGTLNLRNSIVASNKAGDGPDVYSPTADGDYNLVQDPTGANLQGNHNITGQDPTLSTLSNHGGPTKTLALLPGSAAINNGQTSLRTDQRGVARPSDTKSDIGAYESIKDTTSPTLVISNLKEGQNIALSSFSSAAGRASDDVGIAEVWVTFARSRGGVTLFWDGTSFANTPTPLPTRLAYKGSIDTAWRFLVTPALKTALDAGAYTISAYAKDAAGNQSNVATRSFTLTASSAANNESGNPAGSSAAAS